MALHKIGSKVDTEGATLGPLREAYFSMPALSSRLSRGLSLVSWDIEMHEMTPSNGLISGWYPKHTWFISCLMLKPPKVGVRRSTF